jgi:hypothetical protein
MKSVAAYKSLDLGDGSEVVRALMGNAPSEADQNSIVISGARHSHDARTPAALTPAMQSWYSRHIAPSRLAAIAEIRTAFEEDSHGAARGVYLEADRDAALRKEVAGAIDQAERFADQHGKLLNEHARCETEFATYRARLHREPVRTARWIYVLLLIGIILLEAAINFESFLRVPYITSPFLATGATLAVGLGIGFASHFHGIVLKQWHYHFSPQEAGEHGYEGRRRDAIKRLIFGGLLLFVALSMVAGARYYYLLDHVIRARILGVSPPSMFGGIFFMLLGNVVAYAVGVLLSYSTHDAHPLYAERDRELRRSTRKIEELKKQRGASLQRLRDGADAHVKEISNQEATTRGPRYAELRAAADDIVNKDQEVIGALVGYRSALFAAMGERTGKTRFRYPDGAYIKLLPDRTDDHLSAEEYAAMPLSLGFAEG